MVACPVGMFFYACILGGFLNKLLGGWRGVERGLAALVAR